MFMVAAQNDLRSVYTWVYRNDSKQAARKLLDELKRTCENLQSLPERGHTPPELQMINVRRYLEIHCKHFRIIYEILDDKVYIHAVLDGRRSVQELLLERLLR